jgi:Domain of unknown function (DUF4388)
MGLSGDLATFELTEILEWIARRKRTGSLELRRRSTRKGLLFRSGLLRGTSSNDPREAIGQFLVRDRRISEEQLFQALLRQEKEGRLLGSSLVAEGLLTERELRETLLVQAEATVYDLFLWIGGEFRFEDGDVQEPVHVVLGLDPLLLLREGKRRLERWRAIRTRLPSAGVSFRVTGAGHGTENSRERQALGLAAAGKTLEEIGLEMRLSRFGAADLLDGLCERGALVVEGAASDAMTDTVGTIEGLLAGAQQRLREGRFSQAFQAYEEVLGLDGLNQEAKKGLLAVSQARERERRQRRVPQDKVPVMRLGAMALAREKFDAHEGFLLSRINGHWNVQSILKVCPMPEAEAIEIFVRLLERKVIELNDPSPAPHKPSSPARR